jgi:hypothetical protein
MIPGKSIASNVVFVSGYYRTNNSGCEVTGLDWNTGQTVHRTILGTSIYGNGMYAPLEFLPDGDLFSAEYWDSFAFKCRADSSIRPDCRSNAHLKTLADANARAVQQRADRAEVHEGDKVIA